MTKLKVLVLVFRAVKIYVTAVEVVRKNERQDETQFTAKINGFLSVVVPCLNANVLFCRFFFLKNLTLCNDQTQGSSAGV